MFDPLSDPTSRQAIVSQGRRLAELGLIQNTSGNLSLRHGDGLLLTPTGRACDRLEVTDIVYMDRAGRPSGPLRPTSEWRFHRDILAERADIHAVVHTHAPYATAVAIQRRDIPPLHYMIAAAGGTTIRCAGYETFGTASLSTEVLAALEGRLACLMANHGMIACGATLEKAVALAIEVEALARQYVIALQLGGPTLLDHHEMDRVLEKFRDYGAQPSNAGEA